MLEGSMKFKKVQKWSKRFKKSKGSKSPKFKNVKTNLIKFGKVQEGSRRFNKASKGSRWFKKILNSKIRFKKVQEGSQMFKNGERIQAVLINWFFLWLGSKLRRLWHDSFIYRLNSLLIKCRSFRDLTKALLISKPSSSAHSFLFQGNRFFPSGFWRTY